MTKNNNNDEILFPPFFPPSEPNGVKSFKQSVLVNIYYFYLTEEIGEPSYYTEMINVLRTAEEHDKIMLCINNPGGSINTTLQIISAINESNATVITSLEGQACSAATMIFLSGHQHVVNKNSSFMIHTFSEWGGGKGNEQKVRMEFVHTYFDKLFRDIYSGFLTDEEIKSVLNGNDIWMDADEVLLRLEGFYKRKESLNEENVYKTIDDMNAYTQELMKSNNITEKDLAKRMTNKKQKTK
jgi:ATP-dependent protease ClpP protease subunit